MNKFDLGLPKFEDTLFSTEEQRQEARLEKVMKIPISEVHDFKQHPFHVRMDEDMVKLVDLFGITNYRRDFLDLK